MAAPTARRPRPTSIPTCRLASCRFRANFTESSWAPISALTQRGSADPLISLVISFMVVRRKAFICCRCKARQLSELPQAPGLKECARARTDSIFEALCAGRGAPDPHHHHHHHHTHTPPDRAPFRFRGASLPSRDPQIRAALCRQPSHTPAHTPHTPACSPLACMHARVRTCMHVRAKRRPLPPLYTENTVLFSMLARLIALVAHASHRHQPQLASQLDVIPAGLLS